MSEAHEDEDRRLREHVDKNLVWNFLAREFGSNIVALRLVPLTYVSACDVSVNIHSLNIFESSFSPGRSLF